MNFCHECGSEIAEIEAFCPFCGISLKPAEVSESVSGEQDKTIAVNQTDFEKQLPPSNAGQDEKNIEASVSNSELDINDGMPVNAESDLKTGAEDSEPVESQPKKELENKADFSDISEPAQPAEQVESTEKTALPTDATLVDIPKPQVSDGSVENAEKNVAEEKISQPVAQESVSKTDAQVVDSVVTEPEPQAKLEETSSDSQLPDEEYVQTVPYVNYQELTNAESVENESPARSAEDLKAETENEPEIEKPEIPVEEAENRDTTFDSVKIREDEDENAEDSKSFISTDDIKLEAESQIVESEKERPQTTPNIGVGDTDGRKSPKLKPLDEGTVLNGRYEIVRKIGGGGMGAVYLATDRNLGGILRAVKEMIQSYIEEEQQDKAISDFKRESMLLTSLDHPSIPTIYDYFYDEKEGRFYLVMKYISGGDLASRLRSAPEGRIDEETVVGWAIQIADVLDYLHNRQPPIVYRDLKPANIMIDGNTGRTMLIDFGIARWINKEEKGVTAVGTMGYAPPELFSGKVEPSSDIYSLGSTIFHLLTGADPQSNPLLIFDFQKHPRPRQINPQLSDQIEKILMKMVEYNAEKRYKSAGEVRDVLTKHYENLKGGKITYGVSKTPSAVSFSEQMVFCGFCGQKIVATDMFCAFCGSKQPLAQQGVHSAEYHLPQTTAKLMILGTNELETPTFVIEKDDNLLGRRDPLSNIFPEIDLSKFDPQTKISRRHAHIWREGNEFMIEDLGSSNGTLVMRVVGDAVKLNPHQPHTLINGEKIKVGDTTLHFVVG